MPNICHRISAARINGLFCCAEAALAGYQNNSTWRALLAWALIVFALCVASVAIVLF
jgi:hypothetical protein